MQTSCQVIGSGNWLRLVRLGWTNSKGQFRTWESCQRLRVSQKDCNVIAILALFPNKDTLLVKQFRPATGKVCIELPAGLIEQPDDANGEGKEENSLAAACRELKEETGYSSSDCKIISPVLFTDPGLGNTTMRYACVQVKENEAKVELSPDEQEEIIEVMRIPLDRLRNYLIQEEKKGFGIDARLFSFALGISLCTPAAELEEIN